MLTRSSPSSPGPRKTLIVINTGGALSQLPTDDGESLQVPTKQCSVHRAALREEVIDLAVAVGMPRDGVHYYCIDDPTFRFVWEKNGKTMEDMSLIDSAAMTPNHWNIMVGAVAKLHMMHTSARFVIIHGTDSLAYTAAALSFGLCDRSLPIVVTGSQQPLLHDGGSDARRNLIDAVALAMQDFEWNGVSFPIKGVHVCFNRKILRGSQLVKTNSVEYSAFADPRFYPIGSMVGNEPHMAPKYLEFLSKQVAHTGVNRFACVQSGAVVVVKVFPGVDLSYFSSLKFGNRQELGVRAVLIAGLGDGNGPTGVETFAGTLRRLVDEHHCCVAVISDCLDGTASTRYSTSIARVHPDIVPLRNITLEAAITKIYYVINHSLVDNDEFGIKMFHKKMTQSWVGEMNMRDI